MHFLHPSQVKTLSFAYSRGFKFQVFLRKREKKRKKIKKNKKNEKSTKSTYTIVSAICDCPPEVRRKRSMRTELYRRALICVWIARMRSRWWYALLQSMRAEPTYTKQDFLNNAYPTESYFYNILDTWDIQYPCLCSIKA